MNIHTSVVMFVNNYANVMVILVILSFLIQTVQNWLKLKQKATVTEEQMAMLSSKLDYLKRALNQQFLNSKFTYVYSTKAFLWICRQSS